MNEQELAELDLAVRRIERPPFSLSQDESFNYHPTRDRAEAMRLLEKYRFSIWPDHQEWRILLVLEEGDVYAVGPTAAIAICRAVVAAHRRRSRD